MGNGDWLIRIGEKPGHYLGTFRSGTRIFADAADERGYSTYFATVTVQVSYARPQGFEENPWGLPVSRSLIGKHSDGFIMAIKKN